MKKYLILFILLAVFTACKTSDPVKSISYVDNSEFSFDKEYYQSEKLKWEGVDKVWALVDGKPVLQSEVEIKFNLLLSKKKIKKNKFSYEKSRVLDSIINLRIIESTAEKKGILVSKKKVDNTIKDIKKQNNIADDKAFEAFVKKNFKMSIPEYREYLRQQLLTKLLMIYAIDYNRPTEEQAEAFYKQQVKRNPLPFIQANFEYLTVKPKNKSFTEQKRINKIINSARSSALKGKSLASIAAANKEIRYTSTGGYKRLGEFNGYIAGFVYKRLKRRGQISIVFKTAEGYHIIKYYGKRIAPFSEFKDIIYRMMDAQSGQQALDAWLEKQRRYASVTIFMKDYKSK